MSTSIILLIFLIGVLHCIIAAPPKDLLSIGTCSDGSNPVVCAVNPCQFATCPAVEGATCVPDLCGGCNVQWFLNGQKVTNHCTGCADGSQSYNCLVDPCQFATCPSVEGATCVPDYCRGCNARWILNGQEVTDHCTGCPDGSQPYNCKTDPCQFVTCPAIEGAICVPNYCGGCNAQWLLNGEDVTDHCTGCADGSQPYTCPANPCQFATCLAVEGPTCVPDYCGGCNARWILNGQEVTDECKDEI